jgi:hypothetical protein
MFDRRKKSPLDVNQVLASAINAFMTPDGGSEAAPSKNGRASREARSGLGSVGAVAVGAGLAVGARAAYSRARRKLDLERVADAVEQRIKG